MLSNPDNPWCVVCRGQTVRVGNDRHGRQRFRCATCRRTLGTRHAQRGVYKPEQFLAAKPLFEAGHSVRFAGKALGISKDTARSYKKLLFPATAILCSCGRPAGHGGWCDWRTSFSPKMQEYNSRRVVSGMARVKAVREAPLLVWPYLRNLDHPEFRLLHIVNEAVPRTLPEHVRADACQDILTAVISGDLCESDIHCYVDAFTKRAWRQQQATFRQVSLDSLVPGTSRRLEDVIAA